MVAYSSCSSLNSLLEDLLRACGMIARSPRSTEVAHKGTSNSFGDAQLTVDIVAEEILTKVCAECKTVRAVASEEAVELKEFESHRENGKFIVCWDPLDGSSIVDCNWTVGAILGVWELGKNGVETEYSGADSLIGVTGRQQVAAIICSFGPRTTALVSVDLSEKPIEVILLEDAHNNTSSWSFSNSSKPMAIASTGAKIFSPANLRAQINSPQYRQLLDRWFEKGLTLRYTGGLVPDIYQMFIKGSGVFCNPTTSTAPAKLRLVFELAPVAFLVESAGGMSSAGIENTFKSVLDVKIEKMDQRSSFCAGTAEEVKIFNHVFSC